VTVLSTLGDSLSEAFFMFWETLWALVLGFTLSGAVQSFVSRKEMQKVMGDHRPRTIVRTSLLGAASSSCSYAASALAKSLFQRGADFTSSMVFMFASTNLVIELGIVLWLLLGWQFALAEFVGGAIMIALFALIAPRIFPAAELETVRARLATGRASGAGGHDEHSMHGLGDQGSTEARAGEPFRKRLRSKPGWANAAGYTIADITMLRSELLIGYVVAGFLAIAVPESVYSHVFLSGHGLLTDIENVVVGPFIAFISFVCSIGNVPLAAALYKGGISFGGTVAFVFADLIALPLVVIYGKFYGRKLAVRLFFSFWAVMSAAGLAVDLLFRAVGISVPIRPVEIVPTRFEWNYTTFLNIVFLVVFAAVFWLYRDADRFGGGQGYAKDVVCGMQVEIEHAPAKADHHQTRYYFCSDRCQTRFLADPQQFTHPGGTVTGHDTTEHRMPDAPNEDSATAVDPVCGMTIDIQTAAAQHSYAGREYYFCATGCANQFERDPLTHLSAAHDPEAN